MFLWLWYSELLGVDADGRSQNCFYATILSTPMMSAWRHPRYSIHTGSEHILFGAFEDSCLPVELPLMPVAFKKIGYQTHAIGKWPVKHYFNAPP